MFVIPIILFIFINAASALSWKIGVLTKPIPQIRSRASALFGRVAKVEEGQEQEQKNGDKEEMMSIPFNGLLGEEGRVLFEKPLDVYDPAQDAIKDADSLPGKDGSPEKIQAIKESIQNRVEELKASGKWDEEYSDQVGYGGDPLKNVPLPLQIWYQLQGCKPAESNAELVVSITLVFVVSFLLGSYSIFLTSYFGDFFEWYRQSDFESPLQLFFPPND